MWKGESQKHHSSTPVKQTNSTTGAHIVLECSLFFFFFSSSVTVYFCLTPAQFWVWMSMSLLPLHWTNHYALSQKAYGTGLSVKPEVFFNPPHMEMQVPHIYLITLVMRHVIQAKTTCPSSN